MKELIAIGTAVLALTTSSIAVGAPRTSTVVHERGGHISVSIIHKAELRAEAKAEELRQQKLQADTERVETAIRQLKSHVGKTWYVFSGTTPRGWDCSGLIIWTYEQLGVTLEHRASKQADAGTKVTEPKVGDIVAFTYKGYKSAYHVGIYVGKDQMIHAPNKGQRTRLDSISRFAGKHSEVTYTRLIETI